jgi:hypothetical protein
MDRAWLGPEKWRPVLRKGPGRARDGDGDSRYANAHTCNGISFRPRVPVETTEKSHRENYVGYASRLMPLASGCIFPVPGKEFPALATEIPLIFGGHKVLTH